MKLEIGMYVRYQRGSMVYNMKPADKIGKIINQVNDSDIYELDNNNNIFENDVVKAGFNIIDLIKPKDIILSRDGRLYQCWKIYKDYVFTYSKNKQGQTITLVDYQIDKVLTKEQFEQMSYEIGAEDDTN